MAENAKFVINNVEEKKLSQKGNEGNIPNRENIK